MGSAAIFIEDLRTFLQISQVVRILHVHLVLVCLLALVVIHSIGRSFLGDFIIVKLLLEVLLRQLPLGVVSHLRITSKLLLAA